MKVDMIKYKQIREDKNKGYSERQIAEDVGVARETVRRYKNGAHIPGEKQTRNKPATVMTAEVVDYVRDRLEESKELPGKMKYTGTRIYELLVEDMNFKGSISSVRNLIKELKGDNHKAYLPISYDPGDTMQVDWGTERIMLDGEIVTVKYFCAVLSYSGAKFVAVYRKQTTDSFLDALRRAMEFFGGVPGRVIYDNGRDASKQGYGAEAVPVDKYNSFAIHYSFEPVYCNPHSGNEKGAVERLVRTVRDSVLTPMQHVKSLDELNERLETWCVKNMERRRANSDMTIKELFEEERRQLKDLPLRRYDCFEKVEAKVSAYCAARFENNTYSVPYSYCGRTVTVCAYPEYIEIYAEGEMVAKHRRCYERGRCIYELEHFLELLRRKHRGILKCKPVRENVPQKFIEWLEGQKLGAKRTVDLLELGLSIGFEEAMHGDVPDTAQEIPYVDSVTVEEQDLEQYDELFTKSV